MRIVWSAKTTDFFIYSFIFFGGGRVFLTWYVLHDTVNYFYAIYHSDLLLM